MRQALVTDDYARFIQSHVSISVASRDVRRVPSIVRATGCRLSAPDDRITLLLLKSQASQLLADITATHAIAVVFSEPSTHRTLQFKGRDAAQSALADDDALLAGAHREAFAGEIVPLGYARDLALAVHSFREEDLVAVTFTVSDIFEQTPGPKAGVRLEN